MSNSLYIAATGPESGKITLVLGVMEALSRSARKLGFFRPVIKAAEPPDNAIQLVLSRYNPDLAYADTYGCSYAEATGKIARGQTRELLIDILGKYKQLESHCDFVLCEGTDYTGVSAALEFDFNAAVDAAVAKTKMPGSDVAGRATVFIFPELNTGNNLYKAVQRSSGAVAIGPVLQGLNKPVNDLSRGCLVTDIVNTVAVTAILAQTD